MSACATVDPAVFEAADPWPAISICHSCRDLFACRWWAYNTDVAGVAGGVTQIQREQWRASWDVTATAPPIEAFLPDHVVVQENVGAGRTHNQAVTDIVTRRTANGQSALEIALELGTTSRTINRYRARAAAS